MGLTRGRRLFSVILPSGGMLTACDAWESPTPPTSLGSHRLRTRWRSGRNSKYKSSPRPGNQIRRKSMRTAREMLSTRRHTRISRDKDSCNDPVNILYLYLSFVIILYLFTKFNMKFCVIIQ